MRKKRYFSLLAAVFFATFVFAEDNNGNLISRSAVFIPETNAPGANYVVKNWETPGMSVVIKEEGDKTFLEAVSEARGPHWFKTWTKNPGRGKYVFSIKLWSEKPIKWARLFRFHQDADTKFQYQIKELYGKELPSNGQWKTLMTVLEFPQDTERFCLMFQIMDNDFKVRMMDPCLQKLEE